MTPSSRRSIPIGQLVILGVMLAIFLVGAAPGYLKGSWAWQSAPPVAALKQMQQIPRLGLDLPGWETVGQEQAQIAGQTWSAQTVVAKADSGVETGTELLVLVHPQLDPKDMPKVEWTNLQGHFRWTEDQISRVSLTTPQSKAQVKTRFLRGWTQESTYGLMEWYALPGSGTPKPGDWFWRDRRAQLKGDRTPWMAVMVMQPMEPLGEVEEVRESLSVAAGQVQDAIEQVFTVAS